MIVTRTDGFCGAFGDSNIPIPEIVVVVFRVAKLKNRKKVIFSLSYHFKFSVNYIQTIDGGRYRHA